MALSYHDVIIFMLLYLILVYVKPSNDQKPGGLARSRTSWAWPEVEVEHPIRDTNDEEVTEDKVGRALAILWYALW